MTPHDPLRVALELYLKTYADTDRHPTASEEAAVIQTARAALAGEAVACKKKYPEFPSEQDMADHRAKGERLIAAMNATPPPAREGMFREALESIAKNTCCGSCQEAALVAKAALAGEPVKDDEMRSRIKAILHKATIREGGVCYVPLGVYDEWIDELTKLLSTASQPRVLGEEKEKP